MHVFHASNVNLAFFRGMQFFMDKGDWISRSESRVGPVLRCEFPVTTVYHEPYKRVLFCEARDANPFFHFMESLWMLAGRRDVAFLRKYIKGFGQFSDDGVTLHGAYGYRWRRWFGFDQIEMAIKELRNNPKSRRVVISMWSPLGDAVALEDGRGGFDSKDIPCNDMIKFAVNNDRLDMIVFNRSNDMILGAYGANAVHMSFLHEYVSFCSLLPMGKYFQISCDFHTYEKTFFPLRDKMIQTLEDDRWPKFDLYTEQGCQTLRLGEETTPPEFNNDLSVFFNRDPSEWEKAMSSMFFRKVVAPMFFAHECHEAKQRSLALSWANEIESPDWKIACTRWLERRYK